MNVISWRSTFLVLCYTLLLSFVVNGQTISVNITDSLRNLVNERTGTDKISAQLDLAFQIMAEDKNEAQVLTNTALVSAKKARNKFLMMRAYYTMGTIYTELRNNERSLAYLDSALQIAETLNDNWYKGEILFRVGVDNHRMGEYAKALESFNASVKSCILADNFRIAGSSYSMMGTIYRMNGMYDRAIEYITKSKLNYKKAGFTEGSAWAAYLLGRIYADSKLPEKAYEYFQEALKLYQEISTSDDNKNGIAICYEQLAILNIEALNFEKAREIINKALDIYAADKSAFGMSNVYKHLGVIEYSTGNHEEAEHYLNQALKTKKEVNDILSMPGIYEYLGLSLVERGQTEKGIKTIYQGLDMAVSNNQKKIQLDIYSKLTKVYLNMNDFENAIACQNKQIQIQDLILTGGADVKNEQMQAIYEIDEKTNQIAELEKQNEINALNIKQQRFIRNIMIFGILLALFILIIIFWFNRKLRNSNRELNETNAAKDKFFAIIAHDLRGPTSALASLLEHLNSRFDEFSIEELKEILSTLYKSAENVSQLLENLLIWAQSQVAKIEYRPTELKVADAVQNALKGLNQSAENKQIDIKLEIKEPVIVYADPDMVQTILRNILSNAIKFTHRDGMVVIKSALTEKKTAVVSITDNGVGIDKSKLDKIFDITNTYHTKGTEDEMSTGLGLILVKDFIEKNKGTLVIESKENKGTTVSFTLPVNREISA
jgi:signal transduction histidine kinase